MVTPQTQYPLYLKAELADCSELFDLCKGKRIIIVTDENVGPLYAESLKNLFKNVDVISIPSGEVFKTRETKVSIEDQLFELGCGRDTCLIALGGGVVLDITGFVAATYCRGIDVIYIPTTLLAMVDASIGGKTGINTPHGKNLLGTFTQPKAVFAAINTLDTLEDSDYLNAFAEIIKHAAIYDHDYFDFIRTNQEALKQRDRKILIETIKNSCEIKAEIVTKDEQERGIRMLLNFGHTIAHALENLSAYSLPHGQAVAIGMIVEAYIAKQMHLLSDTEFNQFRELIVNFDIDLSITFPVTVEKIKQALVLDKKTKNKIPQFVLLERIGKASVINDQYAVSIEDELLDQALHFLIQSFVR